MRRGKGIEFLPWACVFNTLDHRPKENRIDNAVRGSSPIEIIRYAIIGFHCQVGIQFQAGFAVSFYLLARAFLLRPSPLRQRFV
jgi:hypothetical protein